MLEHALPACALQGSLQGWPPNGGAAEGCGSMYQQVGMGGHMPPMQGYGHGEHQTAFPQQGWENQNDARTQGSSSRGPPDGGNRFGILAGGNDGQPHESGLDSVEREPTRSYEIPTPSPAELQAARSHSWDIRFTLRILCPRILCIFCIFRRAKYGAIL